MFDSSDSDDGDSRDDLADLLDHLSDVELSLVRDALDVRMRDIARMLSKVEIRRMTNRY